MRETKPKNELYFVKTNSCLELPFLVFRLTTTNPTPPHIQTVAALIRHWNTGGAWEKQTQKKMILEPKS